MVLGRVTCQNLPYFTNPAIDSLITSALVARALAARALAACMIYLLPYLLYIPLLLLFSLVFL